MLIQKIFVPLFLLILVVAGVFHCSGNPVFASGPSHQYEETRQLIDFVNDAAELVRTKGEAAFADFQVSGSRWRQGEAYIFVLDRSGKMLVHIDPAMQGTGQIDLTDINGKKIVRGLIDAATSFPNKPDGWYHYQWPVPGGLLPRWKSSYVRLVIAPSGNSYVVGSGMYNDRMERRQMLHINLLNRSDVAESRDVLEEDNPDSPLYHKFVAGEASDTPYRRIAKNGKPANFILGNEHSGPRYLVQTAGLMCRKFSASLR